MSHNIKKSYKPIFCRNLNQNISIGIINSTQSNKRRITTDWGQTKSWTRQVYELCSRHTFHCGFASERSLGAGCNLHSEADIWPWTFTKLALMDSLLLSFYNPAGKKSLSSNTEADQNQTTQKDLRVIWHVSSVLGGHYSASPLWGWAANQMSKK